MSIKEPQSWMYSTIKNLIISDTQKCEQIGNPKEKYIAHVDNKKRLIWTVLWKMEKINYTKGDDVMESTLSFKNFLDMPDIDRVIRKVIQLNPHLDPDPEARKNKERLKRVEYSPINDDISVDSGKDEQIYQNHSKASNIESGGVTVDIQEGISIAKRAMEERMSQIKNGIATKKEPEPQFEGMVDVVEESKKIGWEAVDNKIPPSWSDPGIS